MNFVKSCGRLWFSLVFWATAPCSPNSSASICLSSSWRVTVTSTVAIFALVNTLWTWPNAVVGGVLLLCGILYLMDRFGIGPSTKSRVRDWLDNSGYDIRTIHDSNAFHFVITDNVKLVTDILQVDSDGPITIISAKHKATPERIAAFNTMTKARQDAFWKSVRLELLRYGIPFSDLTLEGDGIAFSDNVMAGRTLTGIEFLKRVLFVRSGARLYWELLTALDEVGASSKQTTTPSASIPSLSFQPPSPG